MDIAQLWASLSAPTRDWLIANNGDALTPEVLEELVRANGSAIPDDWWGNQGDERDEGDQADQGDYGDAATRYLPDDAVDWIEATANDEHTID